MKALLLSTLDIEGGAARSTYRLHQGLQRTKVESQLLVQTKFSDDETVFSPQSRLLREVANLRPTLNSLPLGFYPQRTRSTFSPQWLPDGMLTQIQLFAPDIVNLHWIGAGFLQIETLATLTQPIVWTLHDMWAFTGGCHYSNDCTRYTDLCGACPQLGSDHTCDLSRWIWQRKARAWKMANLTIVTPSRWLATCARSSALFNKVRLEVIPNGIDTEKFRPLDRATARALLRLPQDKYLLLSGAVNVANDPRKGMHLLRQAVKRLSQTEWQSRLELVIYGASAPREAVDLGIRAHYLGRLRDELSVVLALAAADVFVAPSLQENLPNTVLEAIACGTPCVAFNIGGMPDLIDHEHNGYLAQPFDPEALAQGIIWTLDQKERYQKLANAARQKAEQFFRLDLQAARYCALFQQLLEHSPDSRPENVGP